VTRPVNPLMGTYSNTVIGRAYTGGWWVGCYIWYSEERPGRAAAPPSPILAVPNVTAHPSTLLFDVLLNTRCSLAPVACIEQSATRDSIGFAPHFWHSGGRPSLTFFSGLTWRHLYSNGQQQCWANSDKKWVKSELKSCTTKWVKTQTQIVLFIMS